MKIFPLVLVTLSTYWFSPMAYCEPAKSRLANPNKAAQQLFDKLIASRRFVKFPTAIQAGGVEDGRYSFGFKGENYDHPQGAYGSDEVEWHGSARNGGFPNVALIAQIDYRVINDDVHLLSRQKCLANADAIKKLLWPNIEFKGGIALPPIIGEDEYSVSCNWFYFDPTRMLRRSVIASIRKIDGKCTLIVGSESPWTQYDSGRKKAVSYKQALEIATKRLNSSSQYRSAKLASWTIDVTRGTHYLFRFRLSATGQGANKPLNVFVNADNGEALFALPKPTPNRDWDGDIIPDVVVNKEAKARRLIYTYESAWTKRGLVFVSDGFDMPFDGERSVKLLLRDHSGKCSVIFSGNRVAPSIQFAAPWSDWITIETVSGDFAINLANGQTQQLGGYHSESKVVDFKRTNQSKNHELAIFRGESRLFAQSPLLPPTPANVRELNWQGEQNLFFSPDGHTTYTYSWPARIERLDTYGTSIRRLDSSKLLETGSKLPRQIQKESVEWHRTTHRVAGLQFYPEGKHVLMKTWKENVVILNLNSKKETVILPQSILKANAGRFTAIDRIEVGSKQGEVIITAKTKNGSRLVYSCDFKGNGLKLLIPENAQPTRYYRFASGRTGFNVSKELALLQPNSF